MKRNPPQFDLPLTGETFSLVGERAISERPTRACIACKETAEINLRGLCNRCSNEIEAENAHRDFFRD
jgi:hypothetical protein